jgi:peroxiredoxin
MTQTDVRGGRNPKRVPGGKTSKPTGRQRARTRLWIAGVVAAVAVLVLVATIAVQRSAPGQDAAAGGTSGPAPAGGPAEVGEPMTDFRLVTSDGGEVAAAKLRGNDSILWFTTTYCVPCQVGAVEYRALASELGDEAPTMLFVFLDPQEPNSALQTFRSQFGLPEWIMALDSDQLAQRAGVQVLDTKIFVDETGVVRDIDTAPVDDRYLADVRRLATEA